MAWIDALAVLLSRSNRSDGSPSNGSVSASVIEDGESYWWGNSLTGVLSSSPAAGISFNHQQAMTVATVFACSRARAEIMASLPGMVYRENADHTRRRDSDNDLWRLLHDYPNPEMDSMVFYELLQTRTVNRGNGFATIERDRKDRPIALWPVHNSRCEPFRDSGGGLMWRIYTDSWDPRMEQYQYVIVPDRNMLNIVNFGGNGYLAPGVMQSAVEEISLNMAMTQYGAKFFKQGGRPIGVVEHPGFIDDDETRRVYREDINTLHTGAENWHKVATLWDGAKWKELQFSPEQAQFIAGRNYSDKRICMYYNVPPAIVQIFEDYKFNTVDAMIQQFVMTCVRSDAIRFERAIGRKVIHTSDSMGRMVQLFDDPYVFEFVIEALLRGDTKKQAEVLEIERRNGVTNANQWRALSNREPIGTQGDKYIVPGGFEDLDKLGQDTGNSSNQRQTNSAGGRDQGSSAMGYPVAGIGYPVAAESPDTGHRTPETGNRKPVFDREFIASHLESGVPKHQNRSRGGSVADATTTRDELDAVAVIVLAEAVARIDGVTQSALDRKGLKLYTEGSADYQDRIQAVFEKHRELLQSATLPACQIFCRYREDLDPNQLAEQIAIDRSSQRKLHAEITLEDFIWSAI